MKIVQICPTYYPHIGGVEYVVKSVAERLAKKGHDVTVITGEPTINTPREENLNGVFIVRWPSWAPNNAYHIPKMRQELGVMLKGLLGNVDVVHLHNVHAVLVYYGWKAWAKHNSNKGKLIVTPYYHGSGHTLLRETLWFVWKPYVRRILKAADTIHTVSKLEVKLVKEDFDVDAVPIENGVEEFVSGIEWKPSNYVLYAGRIEKYKNIYKLGKIVQILNSRYDMSLNLLVIGEGPYVRNLVEKLGALDLKWEKISFQDYKSYIDYLSHASFFCLLSEKESYPQSVNEANAIGLPVVMAEPWGENFNERMRTLLVNASDYDNVIALKIHEFLEKVPQQQRSMVPTWEEVANAYIANLYS
jgi:glycosyltransferase involved in cell wall biosynthesis